MFIIFSRKPTLPAILALACLYLGLLSACSQGFTVSINNQAVYDPNDRLAAGQLSDPNLQGCVNFTLRQQNLDNATQLTVLSCANSDIRDLENVAQLSRLRFLDIANNNISNITPLEDLKQLAGLNLANNQIRDVSPLLNIASLSSVNLSGNNQIPCQQLETLRQRLGTNLQSPQSCSN